MCYMHFTISTKKFRISDKDFRYVERLVRKLVQFSPWKDPDYPLLDVIIRKHRKRSRDHIERRLIAEDSVHSLPGHETVDEPVYYDGTLDLILPKKRLVANMLGRTVDEAIKDGFDELFRELDTYKGLHFADDSEYYSRQTIRQHPAFFTASEEPGEGDVHIKRFKIDKSIYIVDDRTKTYGFLKRNSYWRQVSRKETLRNKKYLQGYTRLLRNGSTKVLQSGK